MGGTNEPITLNLTEDAMTLIWGVVEEVVRLTNIHAGGVAGTGGGRRGVGGRDGGGSFTDSSGYGDDDDDEVRIIAIFLCFVCSLS